VPCDQLSLWNKKEPFSARPNAFVKRVLKELFYLEGWDNQFFQIMGTDEFHQIVESGGFPKPDQPLSIVVIKRPGYNQTVPRFLIPELGERLFLIDLETPRVSSKKIRDLLKKGILSPHLPKKAANFIKEKGLYGYKKTPKKPDKLPEYLEE
ncbi:hypothetical protein HOF92_09055, partial [bacterium]|nr:hypothetical protein [bacterium]